MDTYETRPLGKIFVSRRFSLTYVNISSLFTDMSVLWIDIESFSKIFKPF